MRPLNPVGREQEPESTRHAATAETSSRRPARRRSGRGPGGTVARSAADVPGVFKKDSEFLSLLLAAAHFCSRGSRSPAALTRISVAAAKPFGAERKGWRPRMAAQRAMGGVPPLAGCAGAPATTMRSSALCQGEAARISDRSAAYVLAPIRRETAGGRSGRRVTLLPGAVARNSPHSRTTTTPPSPAGLVLWTAGGQPLTTSSARVGKHACTETRRHGLSRACYCPEESAIGVQMKWKGKAGHSSRALGFRAQRQPEPIVPDRCRQGDKREMDDAAYGHIENLKCDQRCSVVFAFRSITRSKRRMSEMRKLRKGVFLVGVLALTGISVEPSRSAATTGQLQPGPSMNSLTANKSFDDAVGYCVDGTGSCNGAHSI